MRRSPAVAIKVERLPELADRPVRTCLGCGNRFLKQKMLRFGVGPDGFLEVDAGKKLSGRGAYCCPRSRCLADLAKKRGKLLKVLRIKKVDCGSIERLVDEYR